MTNIETFLASNKIEYVLHEHPALFTCDDRKKYDLHIPGLDCKNLFLKGKKSKKYFLVVLPAEKRADLKKIGNIVNDRFSFGSKEALQEKMKLTPGSVSPFGLINDENNEIDVYMDREVHEADIVNFHPNRNTASLELTKDMFQKFLNLLKHTIQVIDI